MFLRGRGHCPERGFLTIARAWTRPEPGRVRSIDAQAGEVVMSKSADKPKKQQKQKPQKTLKERRSEKRAAKKLGSGSFLPADK